MKNGMYPRKIPGFKFLEKRELPVLAGFPPISTEWEFQTTEIFSEKSAIRLFAELPDGLDISYLDPEVEREEAYIGVRRDGQKYCVLRFSFRQTAEWADWPFEKVIASFTIYTIPDHQLDWHKKNLKPTVSRAGSARRKQTSGLPDQVGQ